MQEAEPEIRAALRRAEKTGRIQAVSVETRLQTTERNGRSDYGTSPITNAILGDVAAPYAQFLASKGYRTGYVWMPQPDVLTSAGDNQVEVRRVGVGGDDFIIMYDLYAYDHCDIGGRARGVREKFSTGNKGGC